MTKNNTPTISRMGSRPTSSDTQEFCLLTLVLKFSGALPDFAFSRSAKISSEELDGYWVVILS